MERKNTEPRERKHTLEHPLDNDRFDNDAADPKQENAADPDEYEARLERIWKHAAWRTEMLFRTRDNGRDLSRPEGTF